MGTAISRWFGSKTSPGTNAIGYVSWVVLKSLCPRLANSASNENKYKSKQVGLLPHVDDPISGKKGAPWRKSDVTTCSSGYPSAMSLRASVPTIKMLVFWVASLLRCNGSHCSSRCLRISLSCEICLSRANPDMGIETDAS